jgi:membrane protein DedA with SNARE-associated domain
LDIVHRTGYVGLFFVMLAGNCGIPVGTEFVVPAAGALVATGHLSSYWITSIVATLGEVVGGLICYTIGYYGGRPFVERWGKYVKLDLKKLDKFHEFSERYGTKVIFISRFLPVIRGVIGLPAGVSRMHKSWFVLYTAAGSAIFCFGLTWVGMQFGNHIDALAPLVHRFSLYVGLALAAIAIVWVTRKVLASRQTG